MIEIKIKDTNYDTDKLNELPTDSLKDILKVLKCIITDIKEILRNRKNIN